MTWPSTERRLALRPARAEAACVLWSALRALALVEVALAYSQPERLGPRQARMLRASMEVEQAPLEAAQPVKPQITTHNGDIDNVSIQRLAENGVWRVSFRVLPKNSQAMDLRCYLTLYGPRRATYAPAPTQETR